MARVQAVSVNAPAGTQTTLTTAGITTTTGNTLVMYSGSFHATAWTPSDSNSNTWTEVPTDSPQTTGSGDKAKCWVAKNITGGAGHTFTLAITTADNYQFTVTEYSGRDTTTPIRAHNGASSMASGTSHTGPSVTASAGDDIFGCFSDDDGNQTFTATGSYSIPAGGQNPNGNNYSAGMTIGQDNVSAGNYTPTYTSSGASSPGGIVLALAVASGGGASVHNPYFGRYIGGM
jgi:hypothetical protein